MKRTCVQVRLSKAHHVVAPGRLRKLRLLKIRCMRTRVIRWTAGGNSGAEELRWLGKRKPLHESGKLSTSFVSFHSVSGVGFPSQASGPPAVMDSVYHTSGFLRLLLY